MTPMCWRCLCVNAYRCRSQRHNLRRSAYSRSNRTASKQLRYDETTATCGDSEFRAARSMASSSFRWGTDGARFLYSRGEVAEALRYYRTVSGASTAG